MDERTLGNTLADRCVDKDVDEVGEWGFRCPDNKRYCMLQEQYDSVSCAFLNKDREYLLKGLRQHSLMYGCEKK
jgi:hypothetical protein